MHGVNSHFWRRKINFGTKNNKKIIIKKILVWHSHNFLLPYITVEEYYIICFTFICNLYFQWLVVDELPAFIVTVNNF